MPVNNFFVVRIIIELIILGLIVGSMVVFHNKINLLEDRFSTANNLIALDNLEDLKADQEEVMKSEPNRSLLISENDFGAKWPFTIEKGILECRILDYNIPPSPDSLYDEPMLQPTKSVKLRLIIFQNENNVYGLNGSALANGFKPSTAILKTNPKKSMQPLIKAGLKLCK